MQVYVHVGVVAVLVSIATTSTAQTEPQPLPGAGVYVAPEPASRPSAATHRREGWVTLSFIVSDTGEVRGPLIEDSNGNEDLEKEALDAVLSWQYKPATLDGKPLEQSVSRSTIYFRREGADESEPGTSFRRKTAEMQRFLLVSELARAGTLLNELESLRRNLYEDAWFWWLKHSYLEEQGGGDRRAMRDALTKAVGYQEDYLPADILVQAIQRLFVLQAQDADLSAALETFGRLQTSSTAKMAPAYDQAVAALAPSVREIRRAISGPATLGLNARIPPHGVWSHRLLRQAFSIADIQGTLTLMEIRCARRNARFDTVSAGLTWEIPATWGDCGVYLHGTEGATFRIDELPGETVPTTDASESAPPESSTASEGDDASTRDADLVPVLRIPPTYPSRALRGGQCGWVRLEFSITETGRTENVRAIDSSDPVFARAAAEALAKWRYRPQIENGRVVRRDGVQTQITFQIEGVCGEPPRAQ